MIRSFTNRDLIPIAEAYMSMYRGGLRMINEDAEGKNINRAEKFVKQNHPEIIGLQMQNGQTMNPRIFTQEIRNMMPNVRGANCKFLLGASRLYFDDLAKDQRNLQRKSARLNKILKLVTSDTHVNEYDHNLNGLSLQQLEDKFGNAVQQNLQNDMDAIGSVEYQKNTQYDIVRIPDFETAEKYGQYTSWCVTHYENMFDNYTNGEMGVFYFCLQKGFQNVPRVTGSGCPMDDYGKSMIAISVNDDGSLNTCTCRWNHDHGGNDSMMSTKEISDFFGVNFYQVFKPRDPSELMDKYRDKAVEDNFGDKMGWLCVRSDDDSYSFDYVTMTKPTREEPTPRIVKYRKVFQGSSTSASNVVCVALDHFYWYDGNSGKMINPPDTINGDMDCANWAQLTSLKGCPRSLGRGTLDCSGCKNLESLDGVPQELENINLSECDKLKPEALAVLADKPSLVKRLLFNDSSSTDSSDFSMSSDGTVTALVDFDDIESVYEGGRNGISWDFIKKLMDGESWDLFYSSSDVPSMRNMDDADFDKILSENGFDVTWTDIADLYNDTLDEETFTEDQSEEILEMLNDDFYDGNGISVVYSDCERNGTEDEAYTTIKNELFPELYLDKDYGVQDGKVKIVLPRSVIVDCFKKCRDYDSGDNIFSMIRMSEDYEGEVDKISVSEPYYGFSGFDDENWKLAVDDFAKRVVDVLSRPPKTEDAEGQTYFDFDKEYLDNPRNKPRGILN